MNATEATDALAAIEASGFLPPVVTEHAGLWDAVSCHPYLHPQPLYAVGDTESEAIFELAVRCAHRSPR